MRALQMPEGTEFAGLQLGRPSTLSPATSNSASNLDALRRPAAALSTPRRILPRALAAPIPAADPSWSHELGGGRWASPPACAERSRLVTAATAKAASIARAAAGKPRRTSMAADDRCVAAPCARRGRSCAHSRTGSPSATRSFVAPTLYEGFAEISA
jgi:hypothetical protein